MKKYFIKAVLLVAFYSIISNCLAQDTIQQWNVGVYDRAWMPPETTQPFWTTHLYKTKGDTLINNISYKKLFYSNDSLFNNSTFFGAIRSDTGKIFVNKANNEYLLYDFNLNIDDTTQIYRFLDGLAFVWKVKVNSISDTIINNRKLKIYTVAYSDTNNSFFPIDSDIWIDEIGSEKYGLLNEAIPPYIVGPDKDFYLLCYKENDKTVLQDTSFNTCFKETIVNSISHKFNNQCRIYPTLLTSNTQVIIESSILITQIKIYDLQGTIVYNKEIGTLNYVLDLCYLKNGFYIVVINDNTFKVLIAR